MEAAIIIVIVLCTFVLGRLTSFPKNSKMEKLQKDLQVMTESRDKWRSKYLVYVMRVKVKELHEKNGYPSED